jgi:hypothetical protein
MAAATGPSSRKLAYEDVDVLRDPDGILIVISKRIQRQPLFTLAIFKVFERNGVQERSSFLTTRQIPAVIRLLAIAEKRILELEAAEIKK